MVAPVLLETQTSVAPLGLRFWDSASNTFISEGLKVSANPKLSGLFTGNPVQATPNTSGVFVFHHLPGLKEEENGKGDDVYWHSAPGQKDFTVTVEDSQRRFFTFSFTAKAPTKGIFAFSCLGGKPSPAFDKQPVQMVPLYSMPGRTPPAGTAGVYATVVKLNDDTPAPYAMLELYSESKIIARGITDEKGRLALFFQYPRIVTPGLNKRPALTKQTWQVEVKVFFSLSPPFPKIPDLCTLVSQGAATPLESLSPVKSMKFVVFKYGEDLILKTENKSVLVLT